MTLGWAMALVFGAVFLYAYGRARGSGRDEPFSDAVEEASMSVAFLVLVGTALATVVAIGWIVVDRVNGDEGPDTQARESAERGCQIVIGLGSKGKVSELQVGTQAIVAAAKRSDEYERLGQWADLINAEIASRAAGDRSAANGERIRGMMGALADDCQRFGLSR